jgi:transcriptional regulator with XRE-family HTH domain
MSAEGEGSQWIASPSLGERLRQCRERLGWTMRHLARVSGVNVSVISKIESGKQPGVMLGIGRKLAEALGVSLDELGGRGLPGVVAGVAVGEDTTTPACSSY